MQSPLSGKIPGSHALLDARVNLQSQSLYESRLGSDRPECLSISPGVRPCPQAATGTHVAGERPDDLVEVGRLSFGFFSRSWLLQPGEFGTGSPTDGA